MHTVVNKTAQLARDRAVRAYGVALMMLPRRHAPRTTVAPQSVLALCELKQEQRVQIGAARPAGVQTKDKAPGRQPSTLDLLFDLVLDRTYYGRRPGHLAGHSDGHYYSRGRAATPPSTRTTTLKLE